MYKLTGMHSHRHPFLGFDGFAGLGADEGLPMDTNPGVTAVSPGAAGATTPGWLNTVAAVSPLIGGAVSALVVYGVSRAFGVVPKQARKIAFVYGGLNATLGYAGMYLTSKAQQIAAGQTG